MAKYPEYPEGEYMPTKDAEGGELPELPLPGDGHWVAVADAKPGEAVHVEYVPIGGIDGGYAAEIDIHETGGIRSDDWDDFSVAEQLLMLLVTTGTIPSEFTITDEVMRRSPYLPDMKLELIVHGMRSDSTMSNTFRVEVMSGDETVQPNQPNGQPMDEQPTQARPTKFTEQ